MKLRTDVSMASDAARNLRSRISVDPAYCQPLDAALVELWQDVQRVQELVDAILDEHRAYHTETSPKFCRLACQLAAAL